MKKFFVLTLLLLYFSTEVYALPTRYDLREHGRITNVKNQQVPGSCWAFAALAAAESNYLTQFKSIKNLDLSEMQLAFFAYKSPKTYQNFTSKKSGTLGLEGNIFMPVAFMARLAGPTNESSLKYSTDLSHSEKRNLSKKLPEIFKRTMRLRDAYFLSGTKTLSDSDKKNLILKYGAIAVSMYSDMWKFKTKGKYYTYFNNSHGDEINHLVVLAGWDDNFSRENFSSPKPSKNGAWLVKNSWGTTRGSNGGYFWMSYEQKTYGGTAFIVEKNNSNIEHYGYDDLGFCGTAKNYPWGANIFKINDDGENLKEVSFYTTENNSKYEIYIYDLGTKFSPSPTSGKLISSLSGTAEFAGYHTVNLHKQILMKKGEYFSVVLELSGNSMPVEKKISKYSENALINANESFFSKDGKNWTDGINLKSNACIKAFTLTK